MCMLFVYTLLKVVSYYKDNIIIRHSSWGITVINAPVSPSGGRTDQLFFVESSISTVRLIPPSVWHS